MVLLLSLELGLGLELGGSLLGPPLEPLVRVELGELVPVQKRWSSAAAATTRSYEIHVVGVVGIFT